MFLSLSPAIFLVLSYMLSKTFERSIFLCIFSIPLHLPPPLCLVNMSCFPNSCCGGSYWSEAREKGKIYTSQPNVNHFYTTFSFFYMWKQPSTAFRPAVELKSRRHFDFGGCYLMLIASNARCVKSRIPN